MQRAALLQGGAGASSDDDPDRGDAAKLSKRCAGLSLLPSAPAHAKLLAGWSSLVEAYVSAAKGPAVHDTLQVSVLLLRMRFHSGARTLPAPSSVLQRDGVLALKDASAAIGVALDDAASARAKAAAAVEELSQLLAQDAVAQSQRTAVSLAAAQATAASLSSELAQSTSSLSALRSEMAGVQVCVELHVPQDY
jgi:hypothetical protein